MRGVARRRPARGPTGGPPSLIAPPAAALRRAARDPHALRDRVVVMEGQGWGPLHPGLGGDPGLDHAVGGAQALQRRLALLLVAEHADEHLGGAQVGAGLYGGHGHEADAGITQIAEIAAPTTSRSTSLMRRMRGPAILLQGLLDLFGLEELEHVFLLDVGVALEHDAALLALLDLLHVVFEAAQRAELAGPDDRALADQADAGGARWPCPR